MSECSDPDKTWFPQLTICYLSMERAAANERFEAKHKDRPYHDGYRKSWAKERSPQHPYHFRDGVNVWVHDVDLSPDDDFLD